MDHWDHIDFNRILDRCNVEIDLEGEDKVNVKVSEESIQLLIKRLRQYYTEDKNAKLRHVLEDDGASLDIRDAFINLAIVKKEKSEAKEDKETNKEKEAKSQVNDKRMINSHEQIYGKKRVSKDIRII